MSDITELVDVLKRQLQNQESAYERQLEKLEERHKEQMAFLLDKLDRKGSPDNTVVSYDHKFPPFDPNVELWKDYWSRFDTFTRACSIPDQKKALIFLSNQTKETYKLLSTLAKQSDPPKAVNELSLNDIKGFMSKHYDPKKYVVRERYKFWTEIKRKPGETAPELAARIRQKAITCDFSSITDPQDEAMRTCFICAINNETVLKSIFAKPVDQLNFAQVVEQRHRCSLNQQKSTRSGFIQNHQTLHEDRPERLYSLPQRRVIPALAVVKPTTLEITVVSELPLAITARKQGTSKLPVSKRRKTAASGQSPRPRASTR
jgi:hypothetical protein